MLKSSMWENLENANQHVKFFRVRAHYVSSLGPAAEWLWLFFHFRHIDFNERDLIREAILICRVTNGGFSYTEICELDLKSYFMLVDECHRINAEERSNE